MKGQVKRMYIPTILTVIIIIALVFLSYSAIKFKLANNGLCKFILIQADLIEDLEKEWSSANEKVDDLEDKYAREKEKVKEKEKDIEEWKRKYNALNAQKQREKQSNVISLELSKSGEKAFVGNFKATAYTDNEKSQGKWVGQTASGMKPQVGVIAVDPKIIPLGTKLYVEGYGYCVAGDTGGAIKGYRVDLFKNTEQECYNFGVRTVKVWRII